MYKVFDHNSLDPFPLEKKSVQMAVTSPPYFCQRNYREDDRQIGLEKNIDDYVAKLVQVGHNIREVLRDDGTFWLNIGDTYNKNKCLSLVPHRVAMALIDDGWILRNTVIWYKPNHMPASIPDRLTSTYEYVFFFAKSPKYYFNLDAIREPHETINLAKHVGNKNLANKLGKEVPQVETLFEVGDKLTPEFGYRKSKLRGAKNINQGARGGFAQRGETLESRYSDGGKNPGDVHDERKFTKEDELWAVENWGLIPGQSARVAGRLRMGMVGGHPLGKNPGDLEFSSNSATEVSTGERLPDEHLWLKHIETECPDCSSQLIIKSEEVYFDNPNDVWSINTKGLRDSHYAVFPTALVRKIIKCASKTGDTVLDPFVGSGTTLLVAESLNRNGIGLDLGYNDVRERRMAKGIEHELITD